MDRILSYILAFSGGFAIMAVEMTIVRLLAPFFGTSAFIWSTIISVVMCMIFLGNVLGGKAADKGYGIDSVCKIHIAASILITGTSQISVVLLYAFFEKLADNMMLIGIVMVASVIILSLPVLFLSFTSPCLIGLLTRHHESTGDISGKIYGIGTLGGLFFSLFACPSVNP